MDGGGAVPVLHHLFDHVEPRAGVGLVGGPTRGDNRSVVVLTGTPHAEHDGVLVLLPSPVRRDDRRVVELTGSPHTEHPLRLYLLAAGHLLETHIAPFVAEDKDPTGQEDSAP